MKTRLISFAVLALLCAAGGCASSRDETWIGSNVGVAVGSPPPDAPPVSR
jgi:hypothetical protein